MKPPVPVFKGYEKSGLAQDAERDLKTVRDIAAAMHYGALPTAWLHVYNLLMELDRAYIHGKFDGREEAAERERIKALPIGPAEQSEASIEEATFTNDKGRFSYRRLPE